MTEVVLMKLNVATPSGELYSKEVFAPHLVKTSEFKDKLKQGLVLGEYLTTPSADIAVNKDNVCLKINDVFISDGYVMAIAEAHGPMAECFQRHIDNRTPIVLEMRAFVTKDPSDHMTVTQIVDIIAFDMID
jgi:hypothetical protein